MRDKLCCSEFLIYALNSWRNQHSEGIFRSSGFDNPRLRPAIVAIPLFAGVWTTNCWRETGNIILWGDVMELGGVEVQAQDLLRGGRYLAALRQAAPIARDPNHAVAHRIEAALVAAAAALRLGMPRECRSYATLAREQAQEPEHLAQANHNLGAAALALLEPDEAETALLAALAFEDTAYVVRARPTILYDLAISYEQRHQDELAVQVYRQAAQHYLEAGRTQDSCDCWQNAAWLGLLAHNVDEAQVLLSLVAEHLDPSRTREQTNQFAMIAYKAMLTGENQEAVELSEELLSPTRKDINPWAQTLAAITAAEVALLEGQPALARGFVDRARAWVYQSECVKMMNLVAAVRSRIYEGTN